MIFPLLRNAWRMFPISIRSRQLIRRRLFLHLPWLFRWHSAFPEHIATTARKALQLEAATGGEISTVDCFRILTAPPPAHLPVRIIAFYLPQFHAIPENDAWWGKGFTEWTNVVRGKPRFPGHYQPHLPGELGFYDLRDSAVVRRQIDIARLYGVAGFAFYFYWFSGRRLLEEPLQGYLRDQARDLPFCLCWANESWTRRWDGREQDVLMPQAHSPEDDVEFIQYISRYLLDSRYIRIRGRPLLIVYRPDLLPDPKATVSRWRHWCRSNGVGELYLAYTQSFESNEPEVYGMDAAIEFPPNNSDAPEITDQVDGLEPGFTGAVYDWTVFPRRSRNYRLPRYQLFRGVTPSWDNDARRNGSGAIFVGSSPSGYRDWLENALRDTMRRVAEPSERCVFVNAWNEWAEGAHLEPDQRYGYAYLEATREALQRASAAVTRRILVVSHDALPHGAQYLALYIGRALRDELNYHVRFVILGEGRLLSEFERIAPIDVIEGGLGFARQATKLAERLQASGITDAILNSTASGRFAPALRSAGIRVLALVHELPGLIASQRLAKHAVAIGKCAHTIVFPSQTTLNGFRRFTPIPEASAVIRPQGLYKRGRRASDDLLTARERLRQELGLESDCHIVLGVGYGDRRKGFDLFVNICTDVCRRRQDVVFVWIGRIDHALQSDATASVIEDGFESRLILPGHQQDTTRFYAGADVFAMTSREDPFPSVVLEALDAGLGVIAFEGAGGFDTLASSDAVRLLPAFDTAAFADETLNLLDGDARSTSTADAAKALVAREFGFRRYLLDILSHTTDPPPRVSVIVPNYNYCRYLPQRIASIVAQSVPIYELIVLDDASTDGSQSWLESQLSRFDSEATVVANNKRSGSPFVQWRNGVGLARGDYVWIAEADDLADPSFLQTVLSGFSDERVVLSYTQSQQIDDQGTVIAEDYLDYVSDISETRWRACYTSEGRTEIRSALAVKNTIPNVSAVLFERSALLRALESQRSTIAGQENVGDWLVYIELLKQGNLSFHSQALNLHRRHMDSVTLSKLNAGHLAQVMATQQQIQQEFHIDDRTKGLALAYAQSLFEEFDLSTRQHPMVTAHPDFSRYIHNRNDVQIDT